MALSVRHFFFIFVIFFSDQVLKFFVSKYLIEPVVLLPFLKLSFVQNTGIAFGLFENLDLRWVFVFFAISIVIFLLHYSVKEKNPLVLNAFSLIIAGAVGNGFDRIFFGSVTDFIAFSFWPAFNIADSAITVGVLLLLYKEIFKYH